MSTLFWKLLTNPKKRSSFRLYALLFGVVFLLLIIPLVFITLNQATEVSADWFDEGYRYRQEFSFTHNANIFESRAITFTLDTAELITDGVMQADCDDTRFTDANGDELEFDLTGTCDNASTTYEVIFPTIINGTQIGYVYYGNSNAQNVEIDSAQYTALTPSGGDPGAITNRTNEETSPGPSAYWSFDEGIDNTCPGGSSDACDGSGNGINGSFGSTTAAPTWQSEDKCVRGKCLYFDGSDDYMQFSSSNTFSTSAGTVSMWVKANGSQASPSYIFSHPQIGDFSRVYLSFQNGGYTVDCIIGGISQVIGTYTLTDSQWTHLACTWDGTSTAFYVNGLEQTALSSIVALSSIAADSYLGSWDGTQEYFNGSIDEVKIYPYARTAAQIKQDYAAFGGSAVFGMQYQAFLSDGLVGYWPMDESSANTCTGGTNDSCDFSGNSNDGAWANEAGPSSGRYGSSTDYDGTNDSLTISDQDIFSINTTNKFTVSTWIKLDNNTGTKAIISKAAGSNYEWELGTTDDEFRAYLWTSAGSQIARASYDTGATTGSWIHVVFTADLGKNELILYQNGQQVGIDNSFSGAYTNGTASLTMGERGDGNADLDGQLDETRIYNKVLSANEIKQLYNWAPGPVAYYDFEDSANSSGLVSALTDRSGNGLDAGHANDSTCIQVPGKYGKAIKFTGTNCYYTPGDPAGGELDFGAGSMTIGLWYKDNGTSDDSLIAKYSPGYQLGESGTNYIFRLAEAPNYPTATIGTSASIEDGKWHYLVGVRDTIAGEIRTYLDGVYANTTSDTTTDIDTANTFLIGRRLSDRQSSSLR